MMMNHMYWLCMMTDDDEERDIDGYDDVRELSDSQSESIIQMGKFFFIFLTPEKKMGVLLYDDCSGAFCVSVKLLYILSCMIG